MKPTILIVEDDEILLGILCKFLEGLKVYITTATSLVQSKEMMDKIPPPDFIFLDLTLTDSDPPNTLREGIKYFRSKNPTVAISILTGNTDEKLEQMSITMGADSFMHKNDMRSQVDLYRTMERTVQARIKKGVPVFQASSDLLSEINQLIQNQ